MRRDETTMHVRTVAVPDRFALRVFLAPPVGWRGSLAGLLKPMVDGLVAALHAHEGPVDAAILDRAPLVDLSLTPQALRDLLTEPSSAPLGCVRLVVARAAGVMWLPAADHLIALDVRITQDEPPGTVVADFTGATSTTE